MLRVATLMLQQYVNVQKKMANNYLKIASCFGKLGVVTEPRKYNHLTEFR
jgi:hypothetical protein